MFLVPKMVAGSDLANGNGPSKAERTNNNQEGEHKEEQRGPMAWTRQSSLRPTSPTAQGSNTEGGSMSLSGVSNGTSQSTPLHQAMVPASPFRRAREDSVDGTLFPFPSTARAWTPSTTTPPTRRTSSPRRS